MDVKLAVALLMIYNYGMHAGSVVVASFNKKLGGEHLVIWC